MSPVSTRSTPAKGEGVKANPKIPHAEQNNESRTHDKHDLEDDDKQDFGHHKKPRKEGVSPSRPSCIVDWLLSDEAFEMANPLPETGSGEIDWLSGSDAKTPPPEDAGRKVLNSGSLAEDLIRYPHSRLTPFQNLICACILSKPLSHKLGLRAIHTLLNPPFGIRTLRDLDEAGYEGRRKVMWEARTQHKEKTANQLGDIVAGIRELCGPCDDEHQLDNLEALKEAIAKQQPKEAQETVVKKLTTIKGIGPGGASIFLRRVQSDWPEVFPYADDRCLQGAKRLGLIEAEEVEELSALVKDERGKFVRLLDTIVGLELEKKIDQAIELSEAGQ